MRIIFLVLVTMLAFPGTGNAQLAVAEHASAHTLAAPRPLPRELTPTSVATRGGDVSDFRREGERPWYRWPLLGAAGGALVGLVVGTGCQDATICIPAPLIGAAWGAALGVAAEILIPR